MRMGGSEMVISLLSEPSASDFDPQGNLAKVDKEDVATSRATFRSWEGSPPENNLRRGQSIDKKLVDALTAF